MRFGSLDIEGRARPVLISDDEQSYCDVRQLIAGFDGDMVDLIARTASGVPPIKAESWQKLAGQKLLAPVLPRRNIFCVGKNYHEHAKEFAQSGFDTSAAKGELAPEVPVIFTKPTSTVIAHQEPVSNFTGLTTQLDYEAELAVIIGKSGRGIARKDALSHVWGYTIINDVTARDLQKSHRQWFIGKSIDSFCPMGPWIVTADQVDVTDLDVRCWINGDLRQNANTRDLIFDVPTTIETISAGIMLNPGDVIATGTPAGVGLGRQPPAFLKSGDVMKITIGNLGTLINPVGV